MARRVARFGEQGKGVAHGGGGAVVEDQEGLAGAGRVGEVDGEFAEVVQGGEDDELVVVGGGGGAVEVDGEVGAADGVDGESAGRCSARGRGRLRRTRRGGCRCRGACRSFG